MTTVTAFLDWQAKYHLGDLASFLGLVVSVLGFALTIYGVFSSRSAALRAEQAATSAVNRIRVVDELVEFTTALSIMDEIRRLHRTPQWPLLLDRYAALRRALVALRTASPGLTDDQRASVQGALTTLASIENAVEKGMLKMDPDLDVAKFNKTLARRADSLQKTLVELRLLHTDAGHG